jgi:2-polyprenyl-3-methyl-5-hydroxy-6-metoxy-1,4-benzoquinol methylase
MLDKRRLTVCSSSREKYLSDVEITATAKTRIRNGFRLLRDVSFRRVPARVLLFRIVNKALRYLGSDNRRYEFEEAYLTANDPWDYEKSTYEKRKYLRTLACILRYRLGSVRVLEVGCSIGVFTKLLAAHFKEVTAIDVSVRALQRAASRTGLVSKIKFARRDIRSFEARTQYDVIVCAEMLYYIRTQDAEPFWVNLDRHLTTRGIIVFVYLEAATGVIEEVLGVGHKFRAIYRRLFYPGAVGAYWIVIFSR